MEGDVEFVFEHEYSDEFLQFLGRHMSQVDCDHCEGTGDVGIGVVVLMPGLGAIISTPTPCEPCQGRGWFYEGVMN